MKIFIDSADLEEIRQAFDWGIADGVTTNPSLVKAALEKRIRAGKKTEMAEYITEILRTAGETPVSLEVTETEAAGMVRQGRRLFEMFKAAGNVCIKIPVNPAFGDEDATHLDGIQAIRELSKAGIAVNCTLVFTPEQALLAAKAGAAYVSPFAGRIDDFIRTRDGAKFGKSDYFPMEGMEKQGRTLDDNGIVSGIDLVAQCVQILRSYGLETELLAASLRNPRQVREAAMAGADISTVPFAVIRDMLKHHKTYEGMVKFTADVVPEYVDIMK